jgi:uncharacterized paraquat-inducible protein A
MRKFLRKGFGEGLQNTNRKKICSCSECNYTEDVTRGIPCTQKKCPKCGATMKGKFCL